MEPWVRFEGCDDVQVFGVLASLNYSIQAYRALFYVAIQVYGALFYGVIQVYGALVTHNSKKKKNSVVPLPRRKCQGSGGRQ